MIVKKKNNEQLIKIYKKAKSCDNRKFIQIRIEKKRKGNREGNN